MESKQALLASRCVDRSYTMNFFSQTAALSVVFIVTSVPLASQLSGLYTIAAGNPGNAFDYGDIGDALDDLRRTA